MMDERQTALEKRKAEGARRCSPSANRNRDVIRDAFRAHMPGEGRILEIGSGTGEHAVHIAGSLPGLRWLPGDPVASCRASIAGWISHSGLTNVSSPHSLDVTVPGWAATIEGPIAGVVAVNVIHIAPFEVTEGLVGGAGELLSGGGRLFLYGPFSRRGVHTAPSNREFDAGLRARDPRWGVRDLENDLLPLARSASLSLHRVVEMPSNNYSVILERF